jgi:glycosyltransferase involved in cell wall biosynthesis
MKILLDLQGCQTTGSRHRGIGRYSMSLAQAMLRAGPQHEFHVLLNAAFADTIEPIRASLAGLVPRDRFHIFHVPPGCSQRDVEVSWRARVAQALRRCAIQQVAPDIVHVSSLFEGLGDDCATEIDPSIEGVPSAVTVYDFIPWIYPERYLADEVVKTWYRRKLDAMRRAALLLGISASACAEAESVLADRSGKVVNVSSAANPQLFFPAPPGDAARRVGLTRPFVMYTGGIDWRKNIEGLVQAFGRLPPAMRSRLQLAIVCQVDAAARAHLASVAKRSGIAATDLVMTGYVSDEDLADLYRSCELFVFPSLHEGFGLPALEALMCGAAVIGSDTSSIPEVIGRDDATFDPRSPDAMAAALRRALEDDAYRASLKAHAPVQAARFSWDHSARVALDAMEQLHREQRHPSPPASHRPRLALLAPLPPVESGITDYCCELVPALLEHYDVELVHDQSEVDLPPALRQLPVRDVAAFRLNARSYDRVLYHFGNSLHHAHMFRLLREVPGAVVLHDFFLGGALNWMEWHGGVPDAFRRALLRSHGQEAVEFDRTHGREEAIARFPVNRLVVERAQGVIVHSNWSMQAAQDWYGQAYSREWRRIPLLRAAPPAADRELTRRQLGLAPDDFLVCSFGHIGAGKLNHRLIEAWHESSLAQDPRCKLVLVGKNWDTAYGARVQRLVDQSPRVTITGYAPRRVYEQYLASADLAVQLRTMSRGETSGAVLDCLGWGVPLVANANGSNAEYPSDTLALLPDVFGDADLVGTLERLRSDDVERRRLADTGRAYVAQQHDPTAVARQYRDAIEAFAAHPQHRPYWKAVESIGAFGSAAEHDLSDAAIALEATWARSPS